MYTVESAGVWSLEGRGGWVGQCVCVLLLTSEHPPTHTHISHDTGGYCSQLTSDNVIQHELGRGETAFKWAKQAKQAPSSHTHLPNENSRTVMDDKTSPEQPSTSVKDWELD